MVAGNRATKNALDLLGEGIGRGVFISPADPGAREQDLDQLLGRGEIHFLRGIFGIRIGSIWGRSHPWLLRDIFQICAIKPSVDHHSQKEAEADINQRRPDVFFHKNSF